MTNKLILDIRALDATHGYVLNGRMIIDDVTNTIEEHYTTEAALRTRLATAFDIWASQVDSE